MTTTQKSLPVATVYSVSFPSSSLGLQLFPHKLIIHNIIVGCCQVGRFSNLKGEILPGDILLSCNGVPAFGDTPLRDDEPAKESLKEVVKKLELCQKPRVIRFLRLTRETPEADGITPLLLTAEETSLIESDPLTPRLPTPSIEIESSTMTRPSVKGMIAQFNSKTESNINADKKKLTSGTNDGKGLSPITPRSIRISNNGNVIINDDSMEDANSPMILHSPKKKAQSTIPVKSDRAPTSIPDKLERAPSKVPVKSETKKVPSMVRSEQLPVQPAQPTAVAAFTATEPAASTVTSTASTNPVTTTTPTVSVTTEEIPSDRNNITSGTHSNQSHSFSEEIKPAQSAPSPISQSNLTLPSQISQSKQTVISQISVSPTAKTNITLITTSSTDIPTTTSSNSDTILTPTTISTTPTTNTTTPTTLPTSTNILPTTTTSTTTTTIVPSILPSTLPPPRPRGHITSPGKELTGDLTENLSGNLTGDLTKNLTGSAPRYRGHISPRNDLTGTFDWTADLGLHGNIVPLPSSSSSSPPSLPLQTSPSSSVAYHQIIVRNVSLPSSPEQSPPMQSPIVVSVPLPAVAPSSASVLVSVSSQQLSSTTATTTTTTTSSTSLIPVSLAPLSSSFSPPSSTTTTTAAPPSSSRPNQQPSPSSTSIPGHNVYPHGATILRKSPLTTLRPSSPLSHHNRNHNDNNRHSYRNLYDYDHSNANMEYKTSLLLKVQSMRAAFENITSPTSTSTLLAFYDNSQLFQPKFLSQPLSQPSSQLLSQSSSQDQDQYQIKNENKNHSLENFENNNVWVPFWG